MPTRPPIHGAAERQRQRQQDRKAFDRLRYERDDRAFYGTTAWQRLRLKVLREQPLCDECLADGRTEAATVVDHVIDRVERPDLALERSNLRGKCKRHHDAKTMRTINRRRVEGIR